MFLILGVSGAAQAFAATATTTTSTKGDRALQAKLLKVRTRQIVTKAKIRRNIQTAKNEIKIVKKKRAVEKKRRTAIKAKVMMPVKP